MPNSLLMDCVENFLEFEQYNFNSRLPSEDFQNHLAYFLGWFDLQYCKSINWLRIQPDEVQLKYQHNAQNIDIKLVFFFRLNSLNK
ncbi:MAG: hypothetical protein ACTSXH_10560 [Promethearchaeota archaeon]